jgi:hypothetical protein
VWVAWQRSLLWGTFGVCFGVFFVGHRHGLGVGWVLVGVPGAHKRVAVVACMHGCVHQVPADVFIRCLQSDQQPHSGTAGLLPLA